MAGRTIINRAEMREIREALRARIKSLFQAYITKARQDPRSAAEHEKIPDQLKCEACEIFSQKLKLRPDGQTQQKLHRVAMREFGNVFGRKSAKTKNKKQIDWVDEAAMHVHDN